MKQGRLCHFRRIAQRNSEDITIERLLESESNKKSRVDKYTRVDILCKDHKRDLIIVGFQDTRQVDYFQRMLYGVSKALIEHIKEGELYKKIKKAISVNIVYFEIGRMKTRDQIEEKSGKNSRAISSKKTLQKQGFFVDQ